MLSNITEVVHATICFFYEGDCLENLLTCEVIVIVMFYALMMSSVYSHCLEGVWGRVGVHISLHGK